MAEFEQIMKDWRRMCKDRRCDVCRLSVNGICNTDPDSRTDEDIIKIENTLTEWAAEHPEPVYPTWVEWFRQKCFHTWLLDPIPADIAEKLGLQPKEAKYSANE